MTKQDLIDLFFVNGKYCAAKWRNAAKVPEVWDLEGDSLGEKVWNGLHARPACHCGKPTAWAGTTVGYKAYCSQACYHSSPFEEFSRRDRANRRWANPAWATETALKMRESHFAANGPNKLAKIAEKQITPLDPITSDRKKQIRWQHMCGEVFLKSFERPSAVFCPKCHVSKGQGELYELIRKSYDGKIVANDRAAIAPKEIDIYLPALKLGFEFNGKYWHPGDGEREAKKSAEAAAAGITIIHIWEKEWVQKALRDKLVAQVLAAISCHGSPAL